MEERVLKNPPIIEAAITFQANFSGEWEPGAILSLFQQILPDYNEWQPLANLKIGITNAEGRPSSEVNVRHDGYLARHREGKFVVQLRTSGVQLSQLPPYMRFDSLAGEALRIWSNCEKYTGGLSGLRMRYINQFMCITNDERGEFLNLVFKNPLTYLSSKDYTIKNFLHQDVFQPVDSPYIATLTTSMNMQVAEGQATENFLVDIGVLCEGSHLFSKNISIILEEMRDLKNEIFYDTLADEQLAKFN